MKKVVFLALVSSICLGDIIAEANLAWRNGSGSKMWDLYDKGCENGNATACAAMEAWEAYEDNDYKKGLILDKKACNGGSSYGCFSVAVSYDYGEGGIKKDKSKVLEYYKKACKLGCKLSCNAIKNLTNVGIVAILGGEWSYKTK